MKGSLVGLAVCRENERWAKKEEEEEGSVRNVIAFLPFLSADSLGGRDSWKLRKRVRERRRRRRAVKG